METNPRKIPSTFNPIAGCVGLLSPPFSPLFLIFAFPPPGSPSTSKPFVKLFWRQFHWIPTSAQGPPSCAFRRTSQKPFRHSDFFLRRCGQVALNILFDRSVLKNHSVPRRLSWFPYSSLCCRFNLLPPPPLFFFPVFVLTVPLRRLVFLARKSFHTLLLLPSQPPVPTGL